MTSRPPSAAIGTFALMISLGLAAERGQTGAPARTFNKDVAPLVFTHCLSCHRPGGGGPFPLRTYLDVSSRAQQIADATKSRYMPLWKPSLGFGGPFVGERRLTDEEIATIATWVEQGATEGDPADLPTPPDFSEGWRLGPPDLVIRMGEPYELPATGPDVYRNFVLSAPIAERKYVAAIEFRPGDSVHHAILRIDPTSSARNLDSADPEPGYNGMLVDRGYFPDGHFLGWTPGKMPNVTPRGMPWPLDPGTDLVLQVHVMPTGRTETLTAEVGFYFSDTPPVRTPTLIRLNSAAIDIPAGERQYAVEDRYTLPVDVSVLALYPHAHYLGRRIESFAELPGGGTRPLLLIEEWDFNWQDEYRYVDPVPLPKGATVVMRYQFDNSSANRRNPNDPPRRVSYGPQSTDEMAELTLQVLPGNSVDHATLVENVWRKLQADDVASLRALVARDPRDHVSHTGLGVRYFEQGDIPQAFAHLEEAVRLDPAFATGHNNLGTALMMRGQPQEAAEHFRRAIALKPDHAQAHNSLGGILQSMGLAPEAERHYRLAIESQPHHAGAHYNLANLLQREGKLDEAIAHYHLSLEIAPDVPETHSNLARTLMFQRKRASAVAAYREALRHNPNLVPSLGDLAWLLATSPEQELRNPPDSVRLAERAAQLTNYVDSVVLDRLAAAYASDGRFEQAAAAARQAMTLARQANDLDFADEVAGRLELYEQRRPFRINP